MTLPREARTHYGNNTLASSLLILGGLTRDRILLQQATKEFESLLTLADELQFTDYGRAECLASLGKCHALLGDYPAAIHFFTRSLDHVVQPIVQIDLAKVHVDSEDYLAARDILQAIKADTLSLENQVDFAIAWAMLAAASSSKEDISAAVAFLKSVKPKNQYFVTRKNEWLIALLETQPIVRQTLLKRLLQSLNRYLVLRPNYRGVGIDINRIIEDLEKSLPG